MKRTDPVRQVLKSGCILLRHGARHDWYQNPRTRACQPVPRHREVNEHVARHILRKLGD